MEHTGSNVFLTVADAPFTAVEPGVYQIANVGPTFTLDIGGDWFIQPNFPGFVVFTGGTSKDPGDRYLVFLTGIHDVVPCPSAPRTLTASGGSRMAPTVHP